MTKIAIIALIAAFSNINDDPPNPASSSNLGVFERSADIGPTARPGSIRFDEAAGTYTMTGGGANMWFAQDEFRFAWKTLDGDRDLTIEADIAFVGAGKNPHRKACLMIRQGLGPNAPYVDAAIHGDGLTSLQFRQSPGGLTHEVQANVAAPVRAKLVKRGKYALLYLASAVNGDFQFSGSAVRIAFHGPVQVGIGVCAHDPDVTETAIFSKVRISDRPEASANRPTLRSVLETQAIGSTDRRVVRVFESRIEAPNWHPDGKSLIYNSGGRLYRIPAAGGEPKAIDTGFAIRCNNDHGVSPDGKRLVISDQSQKDGKSRIYTLPIDGGAPSLVTESAPSYWHGWSPDGKRLAFCGQRGGKFDVYAIPAGGGEETRLTDAEGLDDGPEYSPDGQWIYFNSERTGRMRIWRMKPDGSGQEPITNDDFNNWFPHPSPDGRVLVFLSYDKDVTGHPENQDVTLRKLTIATKTIETLGRFFGGQGTINVPCWSPDGRRIAFVTYQLIP